MVILIPSYFFISEDKEAHVNMEEGKKAAYFKGKNSISSLKTFLMLGTFDNKLQFD